MKAQQDRQSIDGWQALWKVKEDGISHHGSLIKLLTSSPAIQSHTNTQTHTIYVRKSILDSMSFLWRDHLPHMPVRSSEATYQAASKLKLPDNHASSSAYCRELVSPLP